MVWDDASLSAWIPHRFGTPQRVPVLTRAARAIAGSSSVSLRSIESH